MMREIRRTTFMLEGVNTFLVLRKNTRLPDILAESLPPKSILLLLANYNKKEFVKIAGKINHKVERLILI